jgi:hypothetical protein
VVDFLATTGILDAHNTQEIRPHPLNVQLQQVIHRFDATLNPEIFPILVTHILPTDTSLAYTPDHAARMTPLMRLFLRRIGEPMQISDTAAATHKLPPFNTNIPTFSCMGGFAAVLCPALIRATDPLEQFSRIESSIRIIFNETNFEIIEQFPGDNISVLIVKPSINGLYYVWQAKSRSGIVSPFGAKQMLSAKALAFNLSMLIEMTAPSRTLPNMEKTRKNLIAELCERPVVQEFGPTASGAFAS